MDNGNAILERFWSNEVRILHRLAARGHRLLPRLLGAANAREVGLGFLVIEDAGDPLEEAHPVLEQLQSDKLVALKTFADLVDAVSALHTEGMVHRSISPRVLLAPNSIEGPVRLDGFQMSAFIAGLLRGGQQQTDRNAIFIPTNPTSAICLAPERLASLLTGATRGVESFACDVFGLGMAAIQWFAGLPDSRDCEAVIDGRRYDSSSHLKVIQAAHSKLKAAALPMELRRLLEQMTAPAASNRIPSALEVSAPLGRMIGGLAAQFDATSHRMAPTPRLVYFLRETIEHLYKDGIGRTPPNEPDEREYAELVAADLADGTLAWSPRGFEQFNKRDPQQTRRARVVLFGRRYAYFCQYLNEGSRDEDPRVLLVKYPVALHKAKSLRDAPRQQALAPVQAMFFDRGQRIRPIGASAPSWKPSVEQVQYELGGEAGSPVAATAAWLVGYQDGLLASQDFSFNRTGLESPLDQPRRPQPIILRSSGLARAGAVDDRGAPFLELMRREQLLRPMGEVYERAHNEALEAGDTLEFVISDLSGKIFGPRLRFDSTLDPDTVRFKAIENDFMLPLQGRIRPDDRATRVALDRQVIAVGELTERHDLLAQLREPRGIRLDVSRATDDPGIQLTKTSPDAAALVNRIIEEDPLFVVQGPPGTGKTFVGSHVVNAILRADPLARILVSAQSNAATDNMLEAIEQKLPTGPGHPLLLRHASPEALSKLSSEAVRFTLEQQVLEVRKRILAATATPGPLAGIRKQWRKLAKEQELDAELYARLPRAANVVLATCIGAGAEVESLRGGPGFDWVVIEEAAHAWLSEIAVPLVQGDRWLLIGDQAQLPAHGADEVERVFRRDIEEPLTAEMTGHIPTEAWHPYLSHFRHLMEVDIPAGHWTSPRAVIEEQRRMAPDIGELVSRVYYPGKGLRSHPDTSRPHDIRGNGLGFLAMTALVWLDTAGFGADAEERGYENMLEVDLINDFVLRAKTFPVHDPKVPPLMILSPYKAQVRLLSNNRARVLGEECVRTVDSVQGRQAEVVIVSLVRNNSHTAMGRGLGFMRAPERANVMFSRARRLLVVVGSLRHFARFQDTHWGPLVEYFRSDPDRFIVDPAIFLDFTPRRRRS